MMTLELAFSVKKSSKVSYHDSMQARDIRTLRSCRERLMKPPSFKLVRLPRCPCDLLLVIGSMRASKE
jgi:hypothetical protein